MIGIHFIGIVPSHIRSLNLSFMNFRYVAPEYANTGLLNEKSDIYSFGVLLLEAITGRDPVDYARPSDEVPILISVLAIVSSCLDYLCWNFYITYLDTFVRLILLSG